MDLFQELLLENYNQWNKTIPMPVLYAPLATTVCAWITPLLNLPAKIVN